MKLIFVDEWKTGVCEAENLEIKVPTYLEEGTWENGLRKKEFEIKYMAAGIASRTAGILLFLTSYT